MRRLAVKNSARPQAVAAIASGASGLGPSRSIDQAQRLADRLADPADREQQDRAGDGDEDVVEAGDEAEMLFVDCGRGPLLSTKVRSDAAASALSAPAATASSRSFWLYMDNILPDARRVAQVYYCVNTAGGASG